MNIVQFIKMFMNMLKKYRKNITFLDMYKERHFVRYIVTTSKKNIFLFRLHHFVILFLYFTWIPQVLSGWKLPLAQLGDHDLIYKGLGVKGLGVNTLVMQGLGVRG